MRVTHKFNIQYSCTKWIYEDKHCYSLFIALQIFMILNFCYIMSKFSFQLRTFLNSLSSCKILKCYHKLSKSLRSVNHSYQETFYRPEKYLKSPLTFCPLSVSLASVAVTVAHFVLNKLLNQFNNL